MTGVLFPREFTALDCLTIGLEERSQDDEGSTSHFHVAWLQDTEGERILRQMVSLGCGWEYCVGNLTLHVLLREDESEPPDPIKALSTELSEYADTHWR